MTDIVEVISIKLTTATSAVERRVLGRARDEILSLRHKVNELEGQIDTNPNQLWLFGNPHTNRDLFERV